MNLPPKIAETLAPPSPNKNCWQASREDYPYVTWLAGLPKRYTEPHECLDFLREALDLAEKEEIFRVSRAPLNQGARKRYPKRYWEYHARSGGPGYSQFMEQAFNETGQIIFPSQITSFPGLLEQYRVQAATRLSYYDPNGQLMESEVDNIAALLRQVRPAEDEVFPDDWPKEECLYEIKSIDRYRKDGAAIYFFGGQGDNLKEWQKLAVWQNLPEAERDPKERPSPLSGYLGIKLYTDIWFPKVLGSDADIILACAQLGQPDACDRRIPLFDNRELALRHTPRLNRFLQGVRQLVEQRGGDWKYEDSDAPELYKPMFSEDGIILDS